MPSSCEDQCSCQRHPPCQAQVQACSTTSGRWCVLAIFCDAFHTCFPSLPTCYVGITAHVPLTSAIIAAENERTAISTPTHHHGAPRQELPPVPWPCQASGREVRQSSLCLFYSLYSL